jgi:hypothetical protein
LSLKPLVEAFTHFGEARTIRIVAGFGPDPMNCRMGIQRSADFTRECEGGHQIFSLSHADALRRVPRKPGPAQ